MTFPPTFLKRLLDRLDAWQQTFPPTAFAIGVLKKNGDDRGGMYAALITFYGLLSVFPLFLLFITITSSILGPNSQTEKDLVQSALAHFPVIGKNLGNSIHALSKNNVLAYVISLLFLLWGSLGITSALQMASHRAWRRPRKEEPNIAIRSLRGLRLLGVIASVVLLSSVASGVAASGFLRHFTYFANVLTYAAIIIVNVGGYFLALKILAPPNVKARSLIPGTLVGGLGWTLWQWIGGILLTHQFRHTSEIYGFFAIIFGLIFWITVGAQLFLYSTQINVVAVQHSWPRSFFDPSDEVKAELGTVD